MPVKENFAVIDLETTGPLSEDNYVIDVGIVRVERGKIVKTYQTLVKPPISVPGQITRLTGIQDEDLINAPTFQEVAATIESFFENAIFTAHNAPFDYSFLNLEFMRLGRRLERPVICTKNLAHKMLPEQIKLGLDALSERFEIAVTDRHRALPDAELTAKVLLELFKLKGIESAIRSVLSASGDMMPTPPPSFFEHLPQGPGVYRMTGKNEKILFVGSGSNVYLKAMIHFLVQIENKTQRMLCRSTDRIPFAATVSELEALIEEAREIREWKPKYNHLLERWHPGAYLWVSQEDYPQLLIENEPPDSEEFIFYGPYFSHKLLERLLEYAKTKHHLCHYRLGRLRHPGRHYPPQRACMGHKTHQCTGACVGKVDSEHYRGQVKEALQTLEIPLGATESDKLAFAKKVKSEKLHAFGGSWRVKRSLQRLLEESFSKGDPERINCLVEENNTITGANYLFLIVKGLLVKSWRLSAETTREKAEGEIPPLVEPPPQRATEDEATIERLVIQNYLGRTDKNLKINPL